MQRCEGKAYEGDEKRSKKEVPVQVRIGNASCNCAEEYRKRYCQKGDRGAKPFVYPCPKNRIHYECGSEEYDPEQARCQASERRIGDACETEEYSQAEQYGYQADELSTNRFA